MLQCKYCGVQIRETQEWATSDYCSDCALELKLAFEPDISQIPDKIEPIVAYRAWNIKDNRLTAVVKDMTFEPYKRNEAGCMYVQAGYYNLNLTIHLTPHENCSCGFYAFKEFNSVILSGEIFGEVYLWGRIVPHVLGYRAQYCYPKRFYLPENSLGAYRVQSEDIAQVYGIKTIEFKHVNEYKLCTSLADYTQYNNKTPSFKEEENAIIITNHIGRFQCSICGSTNKCYTDERNHYFYCVKCYNIRIKQRHIETYYRMRDLMDTNKMQIPKGY